MDPKPQLLRDNDASFETWCPAITNGRYKDKQPVEKSTQPIQLAGTIVGNNVCGSCCNFDKKQAGDPNFTNANVCGKIPLYW